MPFFRSQIGTKAVILDYDGLFKEQGMETNELQEVSEILQGLSKRDDLQVIIVSSNDKERLGAHFSEFPHLTLVAEHGLYVRYPVSPPPKGNPQGQRASPPSAQS